MKSSTIKRGGIILASLLFFTAVSPLEARKRSIRMADYGIRPNSPSELRLSSRLDSALTVIKRTIAPGDQTTLIFEPGVYEFHPEDAASHELYISNHDQDNPKRVAMMLDEWTNLTIEGRGADFRFHGRMIPLVVRQSKKVRLKNFSIDFINPQIAQVQVLKSSPEEGITFEVAEWVKHRIGSNGRFETYGNGWNMQPNTGIAFERDSKHIVYRTSDLWINTEGVRSLGGRQYHAPQWKDERLIPGTVVAMRSYARPCPGIVLANDEQTQIDNVKVHYAEGMGLIAQRCTDIALSNFGVCLRGADDPRYFTTQADATHFSQCRGKITSNGGLYEGMMDDAINIHGIYLKVKERKDDYTLRCTYEHNQAWGFDWGDTGDEVCFVKSKTMDNLDFRTKIVSIEPDGQSEVKGCKGFLIRLADKLPAEISEAEGYGIENLTWTPEVEFRHNIVRNNRARGALFSSPRRTVCTDNLFDHTSGTAILLCGDCNGWYESGSVRNLLIARNTFVNALTNMFQFTNAVISIYPEIPDLKGQQTLFHGGRPGTIVIKDNDFVTFDAPLLYAKSVSGLTFKKNRVKRNTDYPAFHPNKQQILLERCEQTETEKAKEI